MYQNALKYTTTSCFKVIAFWIFLIICSPYVLFVYTTTHRSLKAYCAILLRRSNFRYQVSLRVLPRCGERWNCGREMSGNFCLNADSTPFRGLLHAVKLRYGTDGFTSPPKESVLGNFCAIKFRRFRPGVNLRSCVPKASTLPLDHLSRFLNNWKRMTFVTGKNLSLINIGINENSTDDFHLNQFLFYTFLINIK